MGNTALHLACEEGLGDIALLLIQNGARYDIMNKESKSALDICDKNLANFLKQQIE